MSGAFLDILLLLMDICLHVDSYSNTHTVIEIIALNRPCIFKLSAKYS